MIGILLITHNNLGASLIDCAHHVLSNIPPHIHSLSILADDEPTKKVTEAQALINTLDQGQGVLILTDLFGSTPYSISKQLCNIPSVDGVAGVNLPMLLRAINYRHLSLNELVPLAVQGGQQCILSLNSEGCCNVTSTS